MLRSIVFLFALLAAADARAQDATPRAASGAPLRVHVRGRAELHAIATADRGELVLHGELIDDAGTPIPGAAITVGATIADDTRAASRVGPLRPCDDTSAPFGQPTPAPRAAAARAGADDLVVETNDRGGFCAIGRAPIGEGDAAATKPPPMKITLRFRGSKVYDAADVTVPVEVVQEHLLRTILRFEPPPETIDLDREALTIIASLRVDRADAARMNPMASAQRAGLTIVLSDERGAHVAEAVTGGDGRARFDVKTRDLAGPGSGELVVRFAGNTMLGKGEWSQPILRRAEAHVALAHPIDRADADDGIPIDVAVTTTRGPVSGGVVEVRRITTPNGASSENVGAATVDENGHAHVVAVFSAGGATQASLGLRYIPAAPWYRASAELRADVKLAGPGIGRQVLLAVVVIAAAAWVVGGWRRAPRAKIIPGVEGAKAPPSGRAGVHVLASPADLVGWRGTVADAHDGSPVAGARLAIIAPAFEGDGVVARAEADAQGAFSIQAPYRSDARLVVESVEHATHEQALPPPSVLGVALITRRRALLDRLVRWARQRGAPFDGSPEPTPGHVRRAASRASARDVEAWASRVEQAAYGSERVDERVEREVRGVEPRGLR